MQQYAPLQGDVGRIMVVLLTDGRANVSLAKSNADPDASKLNQVGIWTAVVCAAILCQLLVHTSLS